MALYKLQGKSERSRGIHYEFDTNDEPLGEGGMGAVYKGVCIDERTGASRVVAVKFIYDSLSDNVQVIERARREAAIQIKHENLVEMLGFIETEDKTVLGEPVRHYHIVSELLEGVSLDDLLNGKVTDKSGNVVPAAERLYEDYKRDPQHFAVFIIKNILSGLMALHDKGYIHRDIDPTNVMVTKDGLVKLIDFGIAKHMRTLTSHDKHLTKAGMFMGKPEYAAPELVLGEIGEQNQTTDIYAVGILLYQCIVGHPPFEGDKADILRNQLHKKLPLRPVHDKEIRKIIERATEKTRAKRYQSAAEFRVALDNLPVGGSSVSFEWKKWHTYVAASVAAVAVLALAVSFFDAGTSEKNGGGDLVVAANNNVRPQDEGRTESMENAIALLHSADKTSGLNMLEKLSDKGDAEATFLLSRLCFNSLKNDDYCPDSIKTMRKDFNIKIDFNKSHSLLEKTVVQNPRHYKALYELGCDYLGGQSRTEAVKRDIETADKYLSEALKYAKAVDDTLYISLIETQMEKYK